MPESQSSFINIRELDKFFGSFQALKNINLSVQEGELICFLGPSGCGKTTLLRAIAGLDLQTHGSIEQAGVDISRLPVTALDFGIVFQSYALFPNLTAEKNIAFGLENAGQSRSNISHRVNELLELVGLPDQGKKYPAQLSGGQQQRIALARAIACSPGLLLLDEPLSALDAKVRVHLRHEVKELQRKLGVTTIMVTHDQEEALAMADRIVVMNHGVIEQIGTPSDVYCNPQSLFVADFIGEMNQIKASVEAPRQVRIGSVKFALDAGSWPHDSPDSVIAAIRPEDVLPLSKDNDAQQQNVTEAYVHEMEFLGSFWRARLRHQSLEKQEIVADFSINAVRRLGLEPGADILIELPSDHLLAFPVPDSV